MGKEMTKTGSDLAQQLLDVTEKWNDVDQVSKISAILTVFSFLLSSMSEDDDDLFEEVLIIYSNEKFTKNIKEMARKARKMLKNLKENP
jgi:hypothetical protein